MLKAYLFGAGGGGARLYDRVSEQYEVIGVVDNDERKWGSAQLRGFQIDMPEECLKRSDYDVVVLTSEPGRDSIINQLRGYGIAENRIITSFIDQPLESRRIFLKSLSVLLENADEKAAVAEAGVFQGDFARYINRYFPDRKLYLFDTFEGFEAKDIALEESRQYSQAKIADYANTSQELVIQKMQHPEQCIFMMGYFPETARKEAGGERFCFANLDLDLYQPTLEGLRWFEDRMVKGGVILIHDYFADNFKGVRHAVNEYMQNTKKRELHLMPIGDGISIAVCGF